MLADNNEPHVEQGEEDSENEITIFNDRRVDHVTVTIDDEQSTRIGI